MHYKEVYTRWLNDPAIDAATHKELCDIQHDEKEIEDRFFKDLAFGTGGLRGVLGAGTNRMNIYTVRKATQGLANYILAQGEAARQMGVVIAHDCRRMSPEFSEEAALVLNGNGIPTYVFDSLRPTPLLSFAVRHLGCTAGIVVTASHNPPEYNGYKVYWADGGQTPYPRDEAIITEVNKVTDFAQIKTMPKAEAVQAGLFHVAGPEVDDAYVACVKGQSLHPEIIPGSSLRVVYTPLHGAGKVPVLRVLSEMGFKHVFAVAEQSEPDGTFPTVKSPNPEDEQAFTLALALAEKENADIVVATDPDSDRVGAFVKSGAGYALLTGNMTGVLLTEYILSQRKAAGTLPPNGAIISTIVSTNMTKAVADAYGMAYFDVLTGFKYIGDKIKAFEQAESHTYIFGFEESYGCLAGDYARDKDAVGAVMLLCEAAAYYRTQGMTLCDVLQKLYAQHGYYAESVASITLKGVAGLEDMQRTMAALRANPPKKVDGVTVTEVRDYVTGIITDCATGETKPTGLPVSDVLYYVCEDGSWFCVRPSGTEPKIKLYFGVCVNKKDLDAKGAEAEAETKLQSMSNDVRNIIGA